MNCITYLCNGIEFFTVLEFEQVGNSAIVKYIFSFFSFTSDDLSYIANMINSVQKNRNIKY